MKIKLAILTLLVVLAFSIPGHAVRQTVRYPVNVRRYFYENNPVLVGPPASASAYGTDGQIAIDSKYVYFYMQDEWRRVTPVTWTDAYLLLETGDKILLETGDFIIME